MELLNKQLEQKLDSFDNQQRKEALKELAGALSPAAKSTSATNMHFHTFFSYNCCGYSPSRIAWLSKIQGLGAAGIVDFDVFDGLDEFLDACRILGLKGAAGMETRVFVPEFADYEINSPGEPGISYHMGVGFTSVPKGEHTAFAKKLVETARKRNIELIKRVNKFLSPVELDYQKDVTPLTPAGNATERHICLAFARKARDIFKNDTELAAFWSQKLGTPAEKLELPESGSFLNLVRSKTMKRGGVGYAQPDAGSFPKMAEVNQFVLACGGIPTLTWLNGLSDGEKKIEKLAEVAMSTGAAVANIIPDRNFTPGKGKQDEKCGKLYEFVEMCKSLNLPIIAGTEMNSPGQKFVDAFETDELKPLTNIFLDGALIVYAHSALQGQSEMGYCSKWAKANFESTAKKNEFYREVGLTLSPQNHQALAGLAVDATPKQILEQCK